MKKGAKYYLSTLAYLSHLENVLLQCKDGYLRGLKNKMENALAFFVNSPVGILGEDRSQ
jgi:hypothetical protein